MLVTGLLVGIAVGFVIQRGRFCVTGMLRDIFTLRSWRGFVALLVVIAVHAIGLQTLISTGVITPKYSNFAPLAVVVGAFIFGLGIVLAAGCASGTWARSGEGLVGSWIALVFYALSASAMKTGFLTGVNSWFKQYRTPLTTIPAAFGVSPWVFAIGLGIVTLVLVKKFLDKEHSGPQLVKLEAASSPLRFVTQPYHVYVAGLLVGILGVIAWPLSAATGRNDGLGITTPSSNLANFLVTGDIKRVDWGVLLVIGILLGSFIAAYLSREYRVRVPDSSQIVKSIFGGTFMGVGASLAGGCTVGNGMVQTGLFSWQGWVALLFFAVGVGTGAKLWLKPKQAAIPATQLSADELYAAFDDEVPAAHDAGATENLPALTANDVAVKTPFVARDGDFSLLGRQDSPVATLTRTSLKASSLTQLAANLWKLDTVGEVCPFPLLEVQRAITSIPIGDELVITFDCTQATDSLPRWAADAGHQVTRFTTDGDAGWIITIRREI